MIDINKQKKILIIAESIKPGGGHAGYLHNLKTALKDLSSEDLSTNILITSVKEDSDRGKNKSANGKNIVRKVKSIVNILTFGLVKMIAFKKNFSKAFDHTILEHASSSDMVILHGQHMYEFAKILKSKSIKFSFMPHSPSPFYQEIMMGYSGIENKTAIWDIKYLKQAEKFLFLNSEYVIFPSVGAKCCYNEYSDILNNKNIKYIMSGVPPSTCTKSTNDVRASLGVKDDETLVMFAGRYVSHKGFDTYIDLSKKFENTSIRFFSAGTGYLESEIGSSIVNLGWRRDIHDLLNASDLVVLPNKSTYFDLMPLEIFSLGKTLITTKTGGNVDIEKYFPDLYLFDPLDLDGMKSKITDLAKNHIGFSSENEKVFFDNFTNEKMLERWISCIKDMI